MTVGELIAKLSMFDPSLRVIIPESVRWGPVRDVAHVRVYHGRPQFPGGPFMHYQSADQLIPAGCVEEYEAVCVGAGWPFGIMELRAMRAELGVADK